MNPDLRRKLLSEGVIGASLALGLHFVVVEPQRAKLVELQQRCGEVQATIPNKVEEMSELPRALKIIADSEQEAARIREAGRLARDESAMFTRIMQLAASHGVRIDRVDPNPPTMPAPRAAPGSMDSALAPGAPAGGATSPYGGQPPAAPPRQGDAGIGYTISLTADYASVGAFLDELQIELGYTLIRSVRMMPGASDSAASTGPTGDLMAVTIETAHFAVDPSPIAVPAASLGAVAGGATP